MFMGFQKAGRVVGWKTEFRKEVQFKAVGCICGGQGLGAGCYLVILVSADLQESRQTCGVGNRAQGLG